MAKVFTFVAPYTDSSFVDEVHIVLKSWCDEVSMVYVGPNILQMNLLIVIQYPMHSKQGML